MQIGTADSARVIFMIVHRNQSNQRATTFISGVVPARELFQNDFFFLAVHACDSPPQLDCSPRVNRLFQYFVVAHFMLDGCEEVFSRLVKLFLRYRRRTALFFSALRDSEIQGNQFSKLPGSLTACVVSRHS